MATPGSVDPLQQLHDDLENVQKFRKVGNRVGLGVLHDDLNKIRILLEKTVDGADPKPGRKSLKGIAPANDDVGPADDTDNEVYTPERLMVELVQKTLSKIGSVIKSKTEAQSTSRVNNSAAVFDQFHNQSKTRAELLAQAPKPNNVVSISKSPSWAKSVTQLPMPPVAQTTTATAKDNAINLTIKNIENIELKAKKVNINSQELEDLLAQLNGGGLPGGLPVGGPRGPGGPAAPAGGKPAAGGKPTATTPKAGNNSWQQQSRNAKGQFGPKVAGKTPMIRGGSAWLAAGALAPALYEIATTDLTFEQWREQNMKDPFGTGPLDEALRKKHPERYAPGGVWADKKAKPAAATPVTPVTGNASGVTFNQLSKAQQDLILKAQQDREGWIPPSDYGKGTKGSLSFRNMNPGNITVGADGQPTKFQKAFGGVRGETSAASGLTFVKFPSYEAGREAQRDLWARKYGNVPISSALDSWAKPKAGSSAKEMAAFEAYKAGIMASVGAKPGAAPSIATKPAEAPSAKTTAEPKVDWKLLDSMTKDNKTMGNDFKRPPIVIAPPAAPAPQQSAPASSVMLPRGNIRPSESAFDKYINRTTAFV